MCKIIINPAQIIRYARDNKKRLYITLDEMLYVLKHFHCTNSEKLSALLQYMHYLSDIPHKPIGICLSVKEVEYVARDARLNVGEKLLWLLLAGLSNDHPQLEWVGTYDPLAQWLNHSTVMIGWQVRQLITMGFLLMQELAGQEKRLMLTLPMAGLLELKLAPSEWPTPFKAAYQPQEERCTLNLYPSNKAIYNKNKESAC